MDPSLNILGTPLITCSKEPLTGFYRDGKCNTCEQDLGSHTVCVEVTQSFLEYTRFRGNDLSTPIADYDFPGLKPGDAWCLCASRWLEAHQNGMPPKVYLRKTHIKALEIIPLDLLKQHAID